MKAPAFQYLPMYFSPVIYKDLSDSDNDSRSNLFSQAPKTVDIGNDAELEEV